VSAIDAKRSVNNSADYSTDRQGVRRPDQLSIPER
jgi:hypothetical protein